LVDRLEGLKRNGRGAPYRVMIVDDDAVMARYYKAILSSAGMTVMVLTEPLKVIQHLADFRPELILMDHYMPEVQGRELAAVIRQEAAFDSIPIVFLSAEDDTGTQQRVMGIGGDDFLNKSIQPEHLLSAIETRARRFRALRATMLRDSLTGLLNHTATKEQLAVDIARMARASRPLSLCLLDLDHFKQVNDSYGHPAGDRVLRALAHLLKQRLRVSDVIGRYGGEEAARVFNEIRESFAAMPQLHEDGSFQVTFSAGLAAYPQAADPARLTDAADKALYKAKAAGRNRVVLAGVAEYESVGGAAKGVLAG
jgi:diguanylate cyclase (GGDEF)-like protein